MEGRRQGRHKQKWRKKEGKKDAVQDLRAVMLRGCCCLRSSLIFSYELHCSLSARTCSGVHTQQCLLVAKGKGEVVSNLGGTQAWTTCRQLETESAEVAAY